METYITLSFLNDFIFCPRSIYFHQLYSSFNDNLYKKAPQFKGTVAHTAIDKKTYTTSKNMLMGVEVFSEKYNICGKIDLFDTVNGRLIERKREIITIYDGYVFQVYAQCFGLRDAGYKVREILIHDLIHNKNFPILLPENNIEMLTKFKQLIQDINDFDLERTPFLPNKSKCENCIYNQLCDQSLC